MDKEDEHSPSEFYYPKDLETFDVQTETGITESQEAIDDFINQQKSANTNKKTSTDMNTLLRYMKANGMKNEKIESLPASELDHLLSKFFLNARNKNGEEYEAATVSSFQRSIQRYLSEKKYPFNILYSRTMSSKNPEKSLQRSESHLFTSTAKETNRKLIRLSTKTKRMLFLKQENSATPIQLRFKELCGGFYPCTLVSEQETKVVSCAGATFSFNSRMMAKKFCFGWPSEAQRPDMVRREDTKERSNQRFMPPIQRDVLSVLTKNSAVTGQWK